MLEGLRMGGPLNYSNMMPRDRSGGKMTPDPCNVSSTEHRRRIRFGVHFTKVFFLAYACSDNGGGKIKMKYTRNIFDTLDINCSINNIN